MQDLAAWCELARDVLQNAWDRVDSEGLRLLKSHLLRQHAAHAGELHVWLERFASDGPAAAPVIHPMRDLAAALSSPNEAVVLSACALLERSVLAAYARATDSVALDAATMRLVRRHKLELKCTFEHYLRRVQTWRERNVRVVETEPDAGTLVAAG